MRIRAREGAALTGVLATICLAGTPGCGGSDSGTDSSPTGGTGLIDWPLFGRVPERTHSHLESSPLVVNGNLYLGDDKTNPTRR